MDDEYIQKRAWLSRGLVIMNRITLLEERLETLQRFELSPDNPQHFKTKMLLEQISEIQDRIQQQGDHLEIVQSEIYSVIAGLKNETEFTVLERYFILGHPYVVIASDLHYSVDWVGRRGARGIRHVVI